MHARCRWVVEPVSVCDCMSPTSGGLCSIDGSYVVQEGGPGVSQFTVNMAFVALAAASHLDGSDTKQTRGWQCWARDQVNWLLGANGESQAYVTGLDEITYFQQSDVRIPTNPRHRGSACKDGVCAAPGEPNPNTLPGALLGGPERIAAFEDSRDSGPPTFVSIEYNAGFAAALMGLSAIEQRLAAEGTPWSAYCAADCELPDDMNINYEKGDKAESLDCDGDGLTDWVVWPNNWDGQWVLLSSEGCAEFREAGIADCPAVLTRSPPPPFPSVSCPTDTSDPIYYACEECETASSITAKDECRSCVRNVSASMGPSYAWQCHPCGTKGYTSSREVQAACFSQCMPATIKKDLYSACYDYCEAPSYVGSNDLARVGECMSCFSNGNVTNDNHWGCTSCMTETSSPAARAACMTCVTQQQQSEIWRCPVCGTYGNCTAAPGPAPAPGPPPPSDCELPEDMYINYEKGDKAESLDCDGDGLTDWVVWPNNWDGQWVLLSSEGCAEFREASIEDCPAAFARPPPSPSPPSPSPPSPSPPPSPPFPPPHGPDSCATDDYACQECNINPLVTARAECKACVANLTAASGGDKNTGWLCLDCGTGACYGCVQSNYKRGLAWSCTEYCENESIVGNGMSRVNECVSCVISAPTSSVYACKSCFTETNSNSLRASCISCVVGSLAEAWQCPQYGLPSPPPPPSPSPPPPPPKPPSPRPPPPPPFTYNCDSDNAWACAACDNTAAIIDKAACKQCIKLIKDYRKNQADGFYFGCYSTCALNGRVVQNTCMLSCVPSLAEQNKADKIYACAACADPAYVGGNTLTSTVVRDCIGCVTSVDSEWACDSCMQTSGLSSAGKSMCLSCVGERDKLDTLDECPACAVVGDCTLAPPPPPLSRRMLS
ncbi:hypothetical protein GPECTOR_31g294 [Gonium pectorale]|uniref:cellulase n=1 Tax=Gonium pectorale TaxID=33097 RepID=A0A150GDL3_GONPE|nr:hypothetical protein GPECTOR_31g294 [Gonium pectorale]|eukprot:KXZ47932.1 hypothetical protein GPECTOR_31g294 [Gonium pectorale]